MDMKELTTYLFKKYGLKFEPMLANSNKFFVLRAPKNPDFFAVLSRIDNSDVGRDQPGHIVTLDLKCGKFSTTIRDVPGFSNPFRIKSDDWVGLWLDQVNESAVKKAIDYAYKLAVNGTELPTTEQYIFIPPTNPEKQTKEYQAQAIPKQKSNLAVKKNDDNIPREIQQMLKSYDYSVLPIIGREKNFYQQGKLMAHYEDDFSESYAFKRYYPTYHDMTVPQLRTYFTWRTNIRRGQVTKTSSSYAFVYVYELLNNIGVLSPLDGFDKLESFYKDYALKYDDLVKAYLQGWLKDYLVFYNLDFCKYGQKYFQNELNTDQSYQNLKKTQSAEELYECMIDLSSYRGKHALPIKKTQNIIFKIWQQLLANSELNYFEQNIAQPVTREVTLFSGAIFYKKNQNKGEYVIDSQRKFYFDHGRWHYRYLLPVAHQKNNLKMLLHEIERLIRQEYQLGRPLKPNKLNSQVVQIIAHEVNAFHQAEIEAKKPKIKIDFSNLGQIRQDASVTRDSLLTDEEKQIEAEEQEAELPTKQIHKENIESITTKEVSDEYDLTADEYFMLTALLKNQPYEKYLKQHHLMASILADEINDKLFDEIGDSVIEFNAQDQPEIITDYQADLEKMFFGKD